MWKRMFFGIKLNTHFIEKPSRQTLVVWRQYVRVLGGLSRARPRTCCCCNKLVISDFMACTKQPDDHRVVSIFSFATPVLTKTQ